MEDAVVRQHERRTMTCDLAEDGTPAIDRQAAGIHRGHAVTVTDRGCGDCPAPRSSFGPLLRTGIHAEASLNVITAHPWRRCRVRRTVGLRSRGLAGPRTRHDQRMDHLQVWGKMSSSAVGATGAEVPVQYFQSVIAIELAVAGALLFQ